MKNNLVILQKPGNAKNRGLTEEELRRFKRKRERRERQLLQKPERCYRLLDFRRDPGRGHITTYEGVNRKPCSKKELLLFVEHLIFKSHGTDPEQTDACPDHEKIIIGRRRHITDPRLNNGEEIPLLFAFRIRNSKSPEIR